MISLEIAKELKKVCEENRVNLPKALWSYDKLTESKHYALWLTSTDKSEIPAYSLEELLEILDKNKDYNIDIETSLDDDNKRTWVAWYNTSWESNFEEATTPEDAAGKLLIYLLKKEKI